MSRSEADTDLGYSAIEVNSYLPAGWSLESSDGSYEPRRRRWQIEVQDVSELVSVLAVDQKEADRLGRIPALRAAIDRLVRKV